ncbi:hypothetical protein H4Q26_010424 [Puccinia striiformis f. sp. tritici PST-130]|nr:hypothetical protein H4Q26_010424 [Puccinia striiformis f. sp. tritici PST-130]
MEEWLISRQVQWNKTVKHNDNKPKRYKDELKEELVMGLLAQRLIEVRWGSVEDTRVPEGVFEDTGTCVED